jgi:hypothetical protein
VADRKLVVQILGDARNLERTFARTSRDASSWGKSLERVGRGGVVATVGFRGLGRSVAFASASFLGGAGFVAGARAAIKASSDLAEEQNKTSVLFGRSANAMREWAKTTATSIGISRRAALQAAGNFGAMFETLELGDRQSATMSRRLVQLGADLASFSNQDPSDMLDRLRSGLAGEAEPLRRFGILLSEARVKSEAYRSGLAKTGEELTEQEKVFARFNLILADSAAAQGDFARTSTQQANQERINAALREEAAARIGSVLLPAYNQATRAVNKWLGDEKNLAQAQRLTQRALDGSTRVVKTFVDVAREIAPVLQTANRLLGGTEKTVKLLLAALVATKIVSFASAITGLGLSAEATTVRLRALRLALLRIAAIDVITLGIEIFIRREELQEKALDISRRVERFFGANPSELPINPVLRLERLQDIRREWAKIFGPTSAEVRALDAAIGRLLGRLDRARSGATRPDDRGGARGPGAIAAENRRRAADQNVKAAEDEANDAEKKADRTKKAAERARKAYESLLDALDLRLDRARETRTFRDDLAVLRDREQAVRNRIRVEGNTTELERELFQIQQDRADIAQQMADHQREVAEKFRAAQKASQFEALGLTAEGTERVAGVGVLRRRLANLREQLKGTTLDTEKTRSQLERIAKVLSGQFGAVGRDVRSAILDMFKTISDSLDEGSKKVTPHTAFQKTGIGKLIEGIGLSAEEIKALRQRMAQVGPGGTVPGEGFGAFGLPIAGAGGGGTTIVINGMTVEARDADAFIREVQKKAQRSAGSRRGPRAGSNRGMG